MNWKKALGYGLAIWILMFVIISAFVAFKISDKQGMSIVFALITAVLAYIFAGRLNSKSYQEALMYGLTWVIVGLVLDYFISTRFAADIFQSTWYWIGYVLVLLLPAVRIKKTLAAAI